MPSAGCLSTAAAFRDAAFGESVGDGAASVPRLDKSNI